MGLRLVRLRLPRNTRKKTGKRKRPETADRADRSDAGRFRFPFGFGCQIESGYCTTLGCTTGSEMNDACCAERKIFCVAARKSDVLRLEDVRHELLRIAVDQREPRALHLHHDLVPLPEPVMLHVQVDRVLLHLVRRDRLRLLEALAEAARGTRRSTTIS